MQSAAHNGCSGANPPVTYRTASASAHRDTKSFTNMPQEIIQQVLEESQPDSFESLVLTCRTIYNLAAPHLIRQYNGLKLAWSKCTVSARYSDESDDDTDDFQHPVCLLYEIQTQPEVVRYIKDLTLDLCEDGRREAFKVTRRSLDLTHLEGNFYLKKCNQDPLGWIEAVHGGSELQGHILLLMMLPNIETLRLNFHWEHESGDPRNEGARQVLDAIVADDRPQRALSKLSLMTPFWTDDDDGTSLDIVRPFMALPSMKKLIGYRLVAEGGEHNKKTKYEWPYNNRTSAVEKAEMSGGAIDRSNLETFLSPLKNLRTFRWDHGQFHRETGHIFNGGALLNCLKDKASKTLTRLTLTSEIASLTAIDTFKDFEKLEELEVDVRLLYGMHDLGESDKELFERLRGDSWILDYSDFQAPRVIDILPLSLRRLRLIITLKLDECIPLFDGFVEQRKTNLPVLSTIDIAKTGSFPKRFMARMQKLGIDVTYSKSTEASHYCDPL